MKRKQSVSFHCCNSIYTRVIDEWHSLNVQLQHAVQFSDVTVLVIGKQEGITPSSIKMYPPLPFILFWTPSFNISQDYDNYT